MMLLAESQLSTEQTVVNWIFNSHVGWTNWKMFSRKITV